MSLTPLAAGQALDQYFLEARSKLLDLAAILDRIARGRDAAGTEQDPRMRKILQALEILGDEGNGRAERIQQIFSLPYDATWAKPKPH